MRKHLFIIASLLFSISLMAEKYTIVFNSGNSDSSTATNELNKIIYTATNNCVEAIIFANRIYTAKPNFGIKGGTGSYKGELAIRLDDTYHITAMTVYAACFGTDSTKTYGINIYDQNIQWEIGHKTDIRPYSITINSNVDSIMITAVNDKNNRFYVQKIEFEAEDPHPTKAILEMPYSALTFEAASWISEDEPMEDAIDFSLKGKNIAGDITLALKSGKQFELTPASLPSTGGDASVSYSITMSAAPSSQITHRDTIIISAQNADSETRTQKLPVSLTIKPKSSGASVFVLDTTGMVYGPMPGDYYRHAQGTADSTLKNHLGNIICRGVRYRYGSGTRKTWDAFYYTDRDTNTNQVLDMYSNNVRYFDPEKQTASVSGFDIEHMLPKSWWGGDVNPAYCDLFHLVPGDYSANRSKSNHAPGIPADSSFNNGSFVTGSGAAYGLARVFCPEDQYKGDFARAYFYIAACYGDSLVWLTGGEPGVAMTNEGWQEFRPWLRDLLVEWHRMDPVSEKEKARAIEVSKIQGNRNPFIDYPELVEYIWGNKQGQNVDFYTLTQSYGDAYSDSTTGLIMPGGENTTARKEFRNGQVIILRNSSIYTPLGQVIR